MVCYADAKPGDLYELSRYWVTLFTHEERTFYLFRRIANTDTWYAYCMETGQTNIIVVSSDSVYERVA